MFQEFEETLVFYESTYFQSFNVKQRNPLRLPTTPVSHSSSSVPTFMQQSPPQITGTGE